MLKNLVSSSSTMFMHAKSNATSPTNVWLELGGRGGLRSTYWHAHAMATNLVAMLNVHDLTSSPTLIHQLLHLFINGLTFTGSKWQVLKV
jgi:hypothetical protein